MRRVDLVVVALSAPLLVGVYEEGRLVERIESEEKTSEALPKIFKELLKKYKIEKIYFARGPGSLMSIKLVYIFLKTLQIAKGIELFGCEGFLFNKGAPIKAVGNLYFVKEGDRIVTKKLDNLTCSFSLPQRLDLPCSEETEPLYVIPAV